MNSILSETELTELICTRISHDVIGNVGAVSNAVELLEEGDMDFIDDIRSILKNSSTVLSARLKFFRLAFGLCNANLDDCNIVHTVTAAYLQTIGNQKHPISLEFALNNSHFCRQAMVAVMIAADTIVKGGRIEVCEAEGKLAVICQSSAPLSAEKITNIKVAWSGQITDNPAQYAPVYYLKSLLKQKAQELKIIETPAFALVMG